MKLPVHVEMGDSIMFCTLGIPPPGSSVTYLTALPVPGPRPPFVPTSEWHAEPESVQRATCPDCLLRIYMLGDSAHIAVERMGMKIEAHDAPAESDIL